MSKVLVIVGSTRPARAADLVLPWVTSRARAHPGFDVEVADLRDWPLPIFAEHMGTIGDISDPTYSEPIVQAWIPFVRTAFGADGEPVNPETDIRLQVMLDDLAWWSAALEKARAAGELPPGTFRARAALATAQA